MLTSFMYFYLLNYCALNEAIDVAQNRLLWRMMSASGATHS